MSLRNWRKCLTNKKICFVKRFVSSRIWISVKLLIENSMKNSKVCMRSRALSKRKYMSEKQKISFWLKSRIITKHSSNKQNTTSPKTSSNRATLWWTARSKESSDPGRKVHQIRCYRCLGKTNGLTPSATQSTPIESNSITVYRRPVFKKPQIQATAEITGWKPHMHFDSCSLK